MLKNYFIVAWRNILRSSSSPINIGGLAVGMAVSLLIGLWIRDEMSFDTNFQHYSRIGRVIQNVTSSGAVKTWKTVPYPLGDELRKSYADDFKYVVMGTRSESHTLALREKSITATGAFYEPQISRMLNLRMISGSSDGLKDMMSVLLSQSMAKAFFGDSDAVNRVIRLDNAWNLRVAGVYADMPYNSSFNDVTYMGTWDLYAKLYPFTSIQNPWRTNAFVAYVQLSDKADFGAVSERIKDIRLRKVLNTPLIKQNPKLFIEPMFRWHLYSEYRGGLNIGGRIQYVWLFSIIGVFVLLLACINFMNLSTAKSEKRSKEVGIRKAIGSSRLQLVWQFFSESLIVTWLAFCLAVLLTGLFLPFFNNLADKRMSIPWDSPYFWFCGIGFCLLTGIVAGSYPALYLSSFKAIQVLKGTFRAGKYAALPRRILVVFQFTVSVTLIIGTIVVLRQIEYAKDRPVGYSRDGLVSVPLITSDIHDHYAAFKHDLEATGAIAGVTEAGSPPTTSSGSSSGFDWPGKDPGAANDFPVCYVTPEYGSTIGWSMEEGRNFSNEFLSDSTAFIVNDAAVKFMQLKDPLQSTIKLDGKPFRILGIVKDMIVESPYEQVRPTFYTLFSGSGNNLIIRINPKLSTAEALPKIEKVFKAYSPALPFDYQFADADYAKKFGNEERIGKFARCFTGLAILISCIGLFAMASFLASQRRKEIGIRKVLGATVLNVWGLLSRDFLFLVIISIVIASPLAYYFMHNWLLNYTYRAELAWWIFAVTAVGALTITLATVSYQSIKAALLNPTRSLRSE